MKRTVSKKPLIRIAVVEIDPLRNTRQDLQEDEMTSAQGNGLNIAGVAGLREVPNSVIRCSRAVPAR